jgi:hypothetical protein
MNSLYNIIKQSKTKRLKKKTTTRGGTGGAASSILTDEKIMKMQVYVIFDLLKRILLMNNETLNGNLKMILLSTNYRIKENLTKTNFHKIVELLELYDDPPENLIHQFEFDKDSLNKADLREMEKSIVKSAEFNRRKSKIVDTPILKY